MNSSEPIVTKFIPNPTQRNFIQSKARADFFSTRVGEGKSAAISWCPFYHTRHNPGARWAVIRDTWENLRRTTLQEFFTWWQPGVHGLWHETNKEWTWAEGVCKGSVLWLGLDDPKDAAKLQSLVLAGVAMDEVSPATDTGGIPELVFDLALTRLRQKGMSWYGMKLASNNADDAHWTYKRFVDPGTDDFVLWQPAVAENERNLPANYYALLRQQLGHRKDLVARFVEGEFGFQQVGLAVTPQFNAHLHLATGLTPVRGSELVLCWDFGLNPTCIITQVTPLGRWLILRSFVGDGIGAQELIESAVRPCLASDYRQFRFRHVGDPAGKQREQSSSRTSAVAVIRQLLGGSFRDGPKSPFERIEPLRAVLSKMVGGQAMVQIDRQKAKEVWMALRGGWHFHETNTGTVINEPVKDIHSHPGDALGYGASRLFPMGRLLQQTRRGQSVPATFFGANQSAATSATERVRVPPELRKILDTEAMYGSNR